MNARELTDQIAAKLAAECGARRYHPLYRRGRRV